MLEFKLSSPPPWPGDPREDRRRAPRQPARQTVGRLDVASRLPGPVEVTDLSALGVRFSAKGALVVGHQYALEIRGNWINLSSRIRVISCRAGAVGAEFC